MVELKNVSVSFNQKDKELRAVSNVNLKINEGEIFGIVGQSGAGKSTLVRVINLLQEVTSGDVIINGKNITHLKGNALRNVRLKIGMIFQNFNLIKNRTVYQNIEFALKANSTPKENIKARVEELLDLVNLLDKINTYPSKLSGGQKQRAAIARALANNPKILLCDEATSALDMANTLELITLLKKINEKYKITIIFITHQMEVAKRLFHRTAVMCGGKIVEIADNYTLFSSPQHSVTKSLVSTTEFEQLPRNIYNLPDFYKLVFTGDKAYDPIISSVSKKYDVMVSITHGKIEYIENKPLGCLYVQLIGEKDVKAKTLEYLKENTFSVEKVGGVTDGHNT